MATAFLKRWRAIGALAGIVVLSWIIYETVHAGSDVPPQRGAARTILSGGSANDKRLDGKSWSLDYDSATLSPDGSQAEIEHVHHGVILRDGKPYMYVSAQHVSANLALNDFTVTGPVRFVEITGERRTLETDQARYVGSEHLLFLDHPTTIRAGSMTFRVANARVDFTSGATRFGRITGTL